MAAFFVKAVFKPLETILRFVFYKIVVKIYGYYFSLIKKLGWKKFSGNFFNFLFNQKLVHVLVILLTLIVVFSNLTNKTKFGIAAEASHREIISNLIPKEFNDTDLKNEFIEEAVDNESAGLISQKKYLNNSAVIKGDRGPFLENAQPEEFAATTNQEGSALIKPEITTIQKTKKPRDKIIAYEVKPGDTVSTIAVEFGVSVNTILWENNLSAYSLIRPEDKLAILPMTGVTHKVARGETLNKIAAKYNVENEKIKEANHLDENSKLTIGQKLIIPGGRKITSRKYFASSRNYSSSLSAIASFIKPSNARPAASNKMNWPTQGHRITQYYSWRHHAIDIANKIGTPIYAADAGIVEYAHYSRIGYGNNIVINHGGGKKTRYAHLSKFYVKKGDRVAKGQVIGAMGSTGHSTGPHLHFEVIINGVKYNPLNYVR